MILGETNIRGLPSDRASWLKYALEQYEEAQSLGVQLEGFCWFPYIDSSDWDSLLGRGTNPVRAVLIALVIVCTVAYYQWMPAVIFITYLLYGFLRPFLSRKMKEEIEDEVEDEDPLESP